MTKWNYYELQKKLAKIIATASADGFTLVKYVIIIIIIIIIITLLDWGTESSFAEWVRMLVLKNHDAICTFELRILRFSVLTNPIEALDTVYTH